MKGKYSRYAYDNEYSAAYVDYRLYGSAPTYKAEAALCIENRRVEASWATIDIDRWKLEESAEDEDQARVLKDREIHWAWDDHARYWE
jgi:hypothetical protein